MEHINPKTQRAIELYNNVQEKKKALKDAKKAFMEVHWSILKEKRESLLQECNGVKFGDPIADIAVVSFQMPNGLCYFLGMGTSETKLGCYAQINSEDLLTKENKKTFIAFAQIFKDIFVYRRGIESVYSEFPPYEYDEAFECFSKAYTKFIEVGAKVVN